MNDTIKILFLAANPLDTSRLALDEEIHQIELNLELGSARDRFKLESYWATRPSDLQRVLMKHKPHIVHFSGHGSKTEEIVFVNDMGNSKPVSRQALADLFRILKDNLSIVVLNACLSKAQAVALSSTIPYAVGTNNEVGDRAAIAFASAFYLALAYERSVQEAFDQARLEISLRGLAGADTPELFVKDGVDATEPFVEQKAAPDKAR